MSPTDGNFNGQTEGLTVTIPGATIAGLSVGSHLFCMRATDAAGNAGAFTIAGNPNCATLEITSADAQAPTIDCTVPDQWIWYDADVAVRCTASDATGLRTRAMPRSHCPRASSAGTEPRLLRPTAVKFAIISTTARPRGRTHSWWIRNTQTVSCGAADGMWHAANVSIACTASDGGSGLATPADANFNLSTSVPSGTETATASTGTHTVADAVGNDVTAGPVNGNMIDERTRKCRAARPMASGMLPMSRSGAAGPTAGPDWPTRRTRTSACRPVCPREPRRTMRPPARIASRTRLGTARPPGRSPATWWTGRRPVLLRRGGWPLARHRRLHRLHGD